MNLLSIQKKYSTEQKCLLYLEKLRWGKTVNCTFCGSENTKRLKSEARRHHCNNCNRHFSVLVGTIFEDTRLSLRKWFLFIGLMMNAKRGISAMQLKRDAGVTYKTAWYIAMRVRCAMIEDCNHALQNIVEMDEAYVGGKPRKKNKKQKKIPDNKPSITQVTDKRGRGTHKTPVVGVVERNGKVVLKVIEKLTYRNLMAMLKENVNTKDAIVITDKFSSYRKFKNEVEHLVIDHSKQFAKGAIHTNNIEGFWSILKNSIRGQYIAISKKYLPFYLVQAQYIFNSRNFKGNLFEEYLKLAVSDEKCLIRYKPKKEVKDIVYPKKRRVKC
jgi:transposase-like protein